MHAYRLHMYELVCLNVFSWGYMYNMIACENALNGRLNDEG